MRVAILAASLVEQVVGKQKHIEGQAYRLMTYVIQCPVEDGVLLYHTLTCSLIWLSHEEFANLTVQQELIDNWFLVPEGHDDKKLCHQIRQMAQFFNPSAKHIIGYTILPTTGCNARCFYCYEKGTKPVTMTAETASKVSRFIMAHRGEEKVKLRWFGGEPLVNVKVIDQICTDLNEHKVPFSSTMISNGYLFDADIVHRAKNLWQLKYVQITLDGTEQTYNQVKAYVYKNVNAFERVLRNIELLTAEGIKVSIRLNVDHHNIDEMAQLVSLLHQRFGTNKFLIIYSHELFGERAPEDNAILYEQRMRLEKQIAACGYGKKQYLQKDIKLNLCMADNDRNVLISPSGNLGKCDNYIDSEFFGHIDRKEVNESFIARFKERPTDEEDCTTCSYYPQCYRLVMCHSCDCTPERQKENIHNIKEAMKEEYQRWLNKNENDNQNEEEDETEI